MKFLSVLIFLFSASFSFANDNLVELKAEDVGLTPIMQGQIFIEEIEKTCPIGHACTTVEPGHKVSVTLPLQGCLDRLVSYYSIKVGAHGTDIYLTALNVHNDKSLLAICTALPVETVEIESPSSMLPIRVHFVGDQKGQ